MIRLSQTKNCILHYPFILKRSPSIMTIMISLHGIYDYVHKIYYFIGEPQIFSLNNCMIKKKILNLCP